MGRLHSSLAAFTLATLAAAWAPAQESAASKAPGSKGGGSAPADSKAGRSEGGGLVPASGGSGSAAASASGQQVKRDPAGVRGISPFMERLVAGDRAFLARDHAGALEAYTEAIKLEPKKAVGHYRQGLVYVQQKAFDKANDAFMDGLRLAYKRDPVRMELLFALSDLRERQRQLSGAIAVWKEYTKLFKELEAAAAEGPDPAKKGSQAGPGAAGSAAAGSAAAGSAAAGSAAAGSAGSAGSGKAAGASRVVGFPETSEERQERARAYLKLEKTAKAVKERAAQRLEEAEKKGRR